MTQIANHIWIFLFGLLSGVALLFIIAAVYAIRKPHKLAKPVQDFEDAAHTHKFNRLLKKVKKKQPHYDHQRGQK